MGKFQGTGYINPYTAKFNMMRPAVAKSSPEPVPAPKLERAAAKPPRKVTAVSNAQPDVKPVSNGAARVARWRAKQDPAVLKLQNREAVQRSRAKKQKTGKAS